MDMTPNNEPILITGCARSGTSMTAGIINICGAYGGNLAPANRSNKRGMFENREIRHDIVKPYLRSIGADPKCQNPLPDMNKLKSFTLNEIVDWQCKVKRVIENHGYQDGQWFYKCPKMGLFWPLWNRAFPKAKWVIVRRKTDDIVYSCMRTGFMNAFQDEKGWYRWVDAYKERFIEMLDANLNIRFIYPQTFINGNMNDLKKLVLDLGLEWKEKEIIDFISPALWKTKKGNR